MTARLLSVATAALLLAACAGTPQASLPTIPTGQELYVIDPSHTFPSFEIVHMGLSLHRGRFNKTTGWVLLDRTARTGSLGLKIDADSIDTGDPQLEERLRAEDFFNTVAYPYIVFKSNRLRFNGDALVGVDGELTLRGVTKPVSLNVTSFRCGKRPITRQDVCGANAETTVKRADFGISIFSGSIGENARLLIQIEAIKR